MKKASSNIFMIADEGLSNDDVGAANSTVFQEKLPVELVSKRAMSLKIYWWGYRTTTRSGNFSCAKSIA